jgi:hypothetical protein
LEHVVDDVRVREHEEDDVTRGEDGGRRLRHVRARRTELPRRVGRPVPHGEWDTRAQKVGGHGPSHDPEPDEADAWHAVLRSAIMTVVILALDP